MKALIVGATGDLGRAIAQDFSARGARLVLHGNKNLQGLEQLGGEVEAVATIATDLTCPGACERLVEEASPTDDPIDTLIVASGYNRSAATVAETTDQELHHTVEVNVIVPFRLVRSAIPHVGAQNGAMVLVSSVFGINAPANRAAYAVAKHGIAGLVQSVAKEEGARLRINAICPGPIWSEGASRIFAEHARHEHIDFEDYLHQRLDPIPAGRFATPAECAAVCWMLSSGDASYINGQLIPVTGGAAP
jgi:NAD(P)-dependent dehydrogenase (short-subunit alcohol dehydrogenase family)